MKRQVLASVLAGTLAGLPMQMLAADLPVRNVVLYKHGIGYFERAGTLNAGDAVQFDFKAAEMDDVLKSLTVDVKGGAIAGVRYDSSRPLEQKLGELPIQLGDRQPLSSLIDQVKGARLETKYGADTIAGTILGARLIGAGDNRPEREMVSLMLDSGEIRNLDLSAASSIRFADPKLQEQLRNYLTAVTQARSNEKRSVYIDATATGRRDVAASYMLPMPIWKSSYRLIFAPTGEPMLEGWAIVDNTTGDDWTNVKLSLVSGRPISFISHLYEPKYITRPVAELADNRAIGPQVYGGIVEADALAERAMVADTRMKAASPAPGVGGAFGGGGGARMAPPAFQSVRVEASNIVAAAEARELGELFEYSFGNAVTVRAGQSAMLPFLQQKIGTRKLLIYSDRSTQNPLNAAELTNSTGKTLDGGPITVVDAGAYAGEALVETVKTGDKRLISYGVDLGTRITTKLDSSSANVREVRMRRGVLTSTFARRDTTTFTIKNVDAKAKTLIIEHPIRPGVKLISPTASETSADKYRFEVPLAASEAKAFTVTEENVYQQTYSVSSLTPDLLFTFIQNKDLQAATRTQLQTMADKKRDIAAADNDAVRLQKSIDEIYRDQQRVRENISNLNNVSGQQAQVQRYAATLTQQESDLAGLRDQKAAAERRKVTLQSELDALIEKADF